MNIRNLMTAAMVLACTFTANAQSASLNGRESAAASSRDLAAIMDLEQRDAAAAKVNDVDTLASLWTNDGVLLLPRSAPVIGITAIRQLLEQQKQQSAMIVTLSYVENWTERRIASDDAYEWGNVSFSAKLPNGKEVSQTGYAIRVLRRQTDGSWKIARAIITPGGSEELK